MRGDCGVAGKRRVGIHGVSAPCHNKYQLRLDVQHFLWPEYYIMLAILFILHGSFKLHLGV